MIYYTHTYEILDGYKKHFTKKSSNLRICPERSKIDLPRGYSPCGINLRRMKRTVISKTVQSNITNKNTELPV